MQEPNRINSTYHYIHFYWHPASRHPRFHALHDGGFQCRGTTRMQVQTWPHLADGVARVVAQGEHHPIVCDVLLHGTDPAILFAAPQLLVALYGNRQWIRLSTGVRRAWHHLGEDGTIRWANRCFGIGSQAAIAELHQFLLPYRSKRNSARNVSRPFDRQALVRRDSGAPTATLSR